jgi:multimeric flavodoxin WrbA
MKKVTAFIGSARKKNTYNAVKSFLSNLESFGEFETEIVFINNYNIKPCVGCLSCFENGEDKCPLKDDRDLLLDKMASSDGVVIATPNYSFQVSGFTKVFLDRIAFIFHRPRFFGKVFSNIVVQGIYGGNKITKYLDFVGSGLGFNISNGICVTTREPVTQDQQKKIDEKIKNSTKRFYKKLNKQSLPDPPLFKLLIFKMSRTGIKISLNDSNYDYSYYKEKGWFESDYYYELNLNFLKKMFGKFSESMIKKTIS